MPRCFLAKKSASNSNTGLLGLRDFQSSTLAIREQQDTNNNHHDESESDSHAGQPASTQHRSTVGSISAAKAVLSIQEPICPPPAHQASILATSSVMKAAMAATHNSKTLEPKNNTETGTQTLPWSSKAAARPPRRKKPLQRLPLNLTLESSNNKTSVASGIAVEDQRPLGLTILRSATTECGKFIKDP